MIDCAISSDASLTVWGGAMNNTSTGGHWQPSEAKHHINYLERLAAYFVLKFFIKDVEGKHIKIMIDNTTAVSFINNMGTCHSYPCNSIIGCKIWTPCEENGIWLTAAHIPGKENVTADYESRYSNLETEWMLNPKYLSQVLEEIAFTPVIHLFASRINKQFDQYVSYRPDPLASYIDAFTISWAETKFYCFPPFSCILTAGIKIRNFTRTHFTFRDNNRLRLEYVERRMVETGSHMSPKVGDSLSVIIQGENSQRILLMSNHQK